MQKMEDFAQDVERIKQSVTDVDRYFHISCSLPADSPFFRGNFELFIFFKHIDQIS